MNEIYTALQAIMEARCKLLDGPEAYQFNQLADALEASLSPDFHQQCGRLRDQANAYASEHGHNCFVLGLRCGLLLLADAFAAVR